MSNKVFIIAEIGVNANAETRKAITLIDNAIDAGVDCIKFQAWTPETFPGEEKWLFKRYEYKALFEEIADAGLEWLCTAFDVPTMHWLRDLGMKRWKIPSGMVTNRAHLEAVREMPGEFILSTGMCDHPEVTLAVGALCEPKLKETAILGHKGITLLHCTTAYPAPLNEINLNAMWNMGKLWWRCNIGLSDHSGHVAPSVAAAALGASMIEVHITLDKNAEGPDHKASLDPKQLRRMVRMVRQVEQALGDGVKRPTESELKVRDEIRRSMGCSSGS